MVEETHVCLLFKKRHAHNILQIHARINWSLMNPQIGDYNLCIIKQHRDYCCIIDSLCQARLFLYLESVFIEELATSIQWGLSSLTIEWNSFHHLIVQLQGKLTHSIIMPTIHNEPSKLFGIIISENTSTKIGKSNSGQSWTLGIFCLCSMD